MTHTLKRYIPLAVLLILLMSLILVGCTQEQTGNQLVLISNNIQFTEGDDDPDLSKIKFALVDKSGNTLQEITATKAMFSDKELTRLTISAGARTITLTYDGKRLDVAVTIIKAEDPIKHYIVYFDCNEVYGANNTNFRGYFDEDPHNILLAPEEYIVGNKLKSLPKPYLNGFDFAGWYPDRLGTGTKLIIQEENPYILTKEETTFYAQWTDVRNFEVRFVNQITSIEISNQTVVHGKNAILPSNYTLGNIYVFNNKNYVFRGWVAEGGASHTNITQDLVVYATFEPQTVAVNFYKEDKKTVYSSFPIEYGGTFNKDDIPLVFFGGEYSPQSHTADWIDFTTESPLPDINITNITKEVKIYIRYTPKPMTLTFYKITKEAYDSYGGDIPSAYKEVISIPYGRTLVTIPAPPLFADDPTTSDLDESNKYKAEWRIYSGDTHTAPNFNAAIVSDKEYFVMYTVYTNTVKFIGYGNDINKICEYGEVVIPPTISTAQYNPLVYEYSWHTNSDRGEASKFNFATRITQPTTLYFKVVAKSINVYYCMPSYYSQSGAGVYDNPIAYEVNTSTKKITIDGNPDYSIDYTIATADYMSPMVNGEYSTAYALSQQTVAQGNGANRKPFVFHKYRQDTYLNETTKWYDYTKTVWDFSGDYYTTLKNYMIANNVAYVVLYAALVTNEQVINFKNVSYTFGANSPKFEPIIWGDNVLPLTVSYGESFDPNNYIRIHNIDVPAPTIEGESIVFTFAGWYTSPSYATGTKIQEGISVSIKTDTTFYAKWVDDDVGSEGLQFELAEDGLSYRIVGYTSPTGGEDVLRIPLFHDGLTVSGIQADIFNKSGASIRNIKEVELRSSISYIAEGVFTALTGLTTISINGNNSDYYTVDNGILYTANMTTLVKYPASKAGTAFTIPQSVVRIAKEAFALSSNLIQVDYQADSALAHIAQGAFWECDNLKAISLPISLQTIEANAFYESAKLATITLQAGTYTIQECGANALGGTKWLASRNGQIILGNVLVMYREDTDTPPTSIIIDNSVSTVADGAFSQGAKTLSVKTITFGTDSQIQHIGSLAFNAATELSAIYIRCASFVDIQLDAFSGISIDATLYVDISRYGDYLAAYKDSITQEILLDIKEISPLS